MPGFRKPLYFILIIVSLLGMAPLLLAQSLPLSCSGSANNPLIRAEEATAMAGDIFIQCSGGVPTARGAPILTKMDFTVFSTTTAITSKITDDSVSPSFNEALLIV